MVEFIFPIQVAASIRYHIAHYIKTYLRSSHFLLKPYLVRTLGINKDPFFFCQLPVKIIVTLPFRTSFFFFLAIFSRRYFSVEYVIVSICSHNLSEVLYFCLVHCKCLFFCFTHPFKRFFYGYMLDLWDAQDYLHLIVRDWSQFAFAIGHK